MAAKKSTAAAPATAAAADATPTTTADVTPVDVAPVAPDVVEAAVPATPATEGGASDAARFETMIEKLQVIANSTKDLISQVRLLQKDFVRLQKEKAKVEQQSAKILSKKDKKVKADGGAVKRSPSGFAKPTKLSDELCSFLAMPTGTEMARTDVTRLLNAYIKQHGLQDNNDKRRILPNNDLQQILSPGDVTYFNLQSKLKHHFISTPRPVAAV
jgi:chromatin remodeling complex protein RSC6